MSVTAKVRVTLEIETGSQWNDDCTIGQIKEQAVNIANNRLSALFKDVKDINITGKADFVDVIYTKKL